MKTTAPIVLAVAVGFVAWFQPHIENQRYQDLYNLCLNFALILASVAYVLGAVNLVQVNYPKIRRREPDWQYKIVLLASALIMGVAGIGWLDLFGIEVEPGSLTVSAARTDAISAGPVDAAGGATLRVRSADRDALVYIDANPPVRAWHDGDPADLSLPGGSRPLDVGLAPGPHRVRVAKPIAGYAAFEARLFVGERLPDGSNARIFQPWIDRQPALSALLPTLVHPGDVVTAETDLVMFWGANPESRGRVFVWIYDNVFAPCNATLFALLAFFIASAAFRAFRARNTEAALLLGAAILVMIGLVPIGRALSPVFPEVEDWIMSVINTAGRRAIMMGAALGAIATGLRIILGIERSHLGSD